jgi:ABC-2 type transport system ATP-binding protein
MIGLNVLESRGLGKRYGDQWALRDCTLALPAGRVVGLVGPNGAGKTTLLQLAVGVLAPSAGEIAVFGRDPCEAKSVLPRIGFVAQDSPLYRNFSVADTLTLGRRLNAHFDEAWAQERLAKLRIPLERKVGELSSGQRAQVALAAALAKRPDLLLLDEPVASLDPLARREFLTALMDAVAEDGLSVILSSHLLADVEHSCDYLILLMASEVRLEGDLDDLLASHRLLVGQRKRVTPGGGGIAAVVRESHSDRQSTLLVRVDGPIIDSAWSVHEVDLEELVLAYMGEQHEPRLQSLPPRLEANG